MGRLLMQLRSMADQKDSKKTKLSEESRKDIIWWRHYLDEFNGISMIVNDNPIPLTYAQLLDSPHDICAGDATPQVAVHGMARNTGVDPYLITFKTPKSQYT